ncbi:hypothetical protein D3C72_1366460 [compost metagenome]
MNECSLYPLFIIKRENCKELWVDIGYRDVAYVFFTALNRIVKSHHGIATAFVMAQHTIEVGEAPGRGVIGEMFSVVLHLFDQGCIKPCLGVLQVPRVQICKHGFGIRVLQNVFLPSIGETL